MGRLMDDLRPKVAAKLMEVRDLDDVDPLARFQAALFNGHPAPWPLVFGSLAVLMEPPTCEVEVEEEQLGGRAVYKICRCSNCGADPWADLESVTNFCPECGAKVVGNAARR